MFPDSKFLLMFGAVVIGPLVVFALAGRDSQALTQPSLLWSELVLAVLMLLGVSSGIWRFKHTSQAAAGLSIAPASSV
jgi:hypothetical protein